MKKTKLGKLYIWVPIMLLTLIFTSSAQAILFTFSDKDYLGGASWGTLEITAKDSDTLMISYTASSTIPKGSTVTGFGFDFSGNSPDSVVNPTMDSNASKWYKLKNLNAIPNPENGDEFDPKVTKSDYKTGVTINPDGNNFNMKKDGLLPGQSDTYFLNFANLGTDLTKINLAEFVSLTGIRLQALPGKINEGSLFLVGKQNQTSVPEPTTLLLFGTGLAFIGVLGRSRVKNKQQEQ